MFERFTDRARQTVVHAEEGAWALRHNYVGTEHLLLGLLHHGARATVAGRALQHLSISAEAAREQVADIIGTGDQEPSGHILFTPRAKTVLTMSADEADRLRHPDITTGHLLLALIHEGRGVAVQVLNRLGATSGHAEEQTRTLLDDDIAAAGEWISH